MGFRWLMTDEFVDQAIADGLRPEDQGKLHARLQAEQKRRAAERQKAEARAERQAKAAEAAPS